MSQFDPSGDGRTIPGARQGPRRLRGLLSASGLVVAVLGLVAAALGVVPPLIDLFDNDQNSSSQQPVAGSGSSSAPTIASDTLRSNPPVTRSMQPAPHPGTVPDRFLGAWLGSVTEDGSPSSPYPVRITLTPGSLGQRVGTSEYVTLKCSGYLILSNVTDGELTMQENIQLGQGNCVNGVLVTLTANSDGSLGYRVPSFWGEGIGIGILHKET